MPKIENGKKKGWQEGNGNPWYGKGKRETVLRLFYGQ
jgi:hypothetical protein